jgi:hypothetical protein
VWTATYNVISHEDVAEIYPNDVFFVESSGGETPTEIFIEYGKKEHLS